MKKVIRLTENDLHNIILDAINESVGDWNEQMFREDLTNYINADRAYDGSVGAANGREKALRSVLGDLPWSVSEYKFRMMLLYTSDTDVNATVERCVDWVYSQLDKHKGPKFM